MQQEREYIYGRLNRYQNGAIYTIRSHQTEKYYIGSTCMPLYKRFYQHRHNYKNYQKYNKNYVSSYEVLMLVLKNIYF